MKFKVSNFNFFISTSNIFNLFKKSKKFLKTPILNFFKDFNQSTQEEENSAKDQGDSLNLSTQKEFEMSEKNPSPKKDEGKQNKLKDQETND